MVDRLVAIVGLNGWEAGRLGVIVGSGWLAGQEYNTFPYDDTLMTEWSLSGRGHWGRGGGGAQGQGARGG